MGCHPLQQTPQAVFPFEVPKQLFKGRIVRKQVQSFGDGQPVAGTDQNGICLTDFFRDGVEIMHCCILLSVSAEGLPAFPPGPPDGPDSAGDQ